MKSSLDANNSEGQFKFTIGYPRSNGLALLYGHVESSLDAEMLKVSSRLAGSVKVNVPTCVNNMCVNCTYMT